MKPWFNIVRILSLSIVVAVTTASVFGRASYSGTEAVSRIRTDYDAGQITLDQKVNLYIDAIKTPDRLPAKYLRPLAQSATEFACPTAALCEIRAVWGQLTPATQQYFSEAFSRPSTQFTFITPSGFFTIHYDTSGSTAVPTDDNDNNTIPDFIERVSAYLDSSLDKHVGMGFLLPPSDGGLGGDSTFDVYFEEMGDYGYAVPEGVGPATWNDYYSYLVLNRNFFGFPPNNDPEGDQLGAAKVTIAHEFHHCVQFAYDAGEDIWYMELDATSMEDITFNACDDNYSYLSYFFSTPQSSLMETSSLHMYGSFPWNLYLFQKFDTSLMRTIWEGARFSSVFNTLSDTLQARYGWSQDSAFADFEVWNFITNNRNDGLHHEEGAFYPLVNVGRTHTMYPVNLLNGPSNPAGYAATYIQFFPNGAIGNFHLTVDGADSRQWKFYVIKSTANNVHSVEEIVAPAPGYSGAIDIAPFENYYRITLVAVNVSEYSTGGIFNYSATVAPPYQVATSVITDTAIYSGGIRGFKFKLSNPSVLPDIYSVIVSDDLGWITLDTLEVAVGAGKDSTIQIPVHPPQGTPLSVHSTLRFIARSWGDTTKIDTAAIAAVTMLQRGDCNFNGTLNIIDLNYMVAFLFAGGPAPLPNVLSADFNCNGAINVLDLIAAANRFFSLGPKPPCNPY